MLEKKNVSVSFLRSKTAKFLWVAGVLFFRSNIMFASDICTDDRLRCCKSDLMHHKFAARGFSLGVQIWPGEISERADVRRELISFLPTQLRFSFGPTWRKMPQLRTGMSDEDLDEYVATSYRILANLDKVRDSLLSVRDATGSLFNLIVWDGPRLPGEGDFNDPAVPQSRVLAAENTKLLARFHVANFRFLQTFGLSVDAVEISNEPDGKWNMQISPLLYLELIRAIRNEAERRRVRLPQIYGPGASRAESARQMFADDEVARGIIDAVNVVSLHAWDDQTGKDQAEEFGKYVERIHQLGRAPEIAITEFALTRPNRKDSSFEMDAGRRVPNNITQKSQYVVESALDLLRMYERGAETVVYWQLKDQTWSGGLYGILDTDAKTKPIFDAFKNINAIFRAGVYDLFWSSDESVFDLKTQDNRETLIALNDRGQKTTFFEDEARRSARENNGNSTPELHLNCSTFEPYSVNLFPPH